MNLTRRHFNFTAGAAFLSSPALAQVDSRPIRLVVGFAAGGGVDTVSRIVAELMGQQLGQMIIVDNRPGADGVISADFIAKSAPDGSTIYVGTGNGLVSSPILRPADIRYDPFRDFTPVTQMGQFTMAWLVAPGMPVSNLAEFIAYVRARPGQLNCASSNHSSRLATAQLFQQHKLEMTHVPYKGDAPAMLDLMANRVHVMVGALAGARAFLKDGKMKALMVQRNSRSPAFPDVPTTQEAGANTRFSPWSGIFGPGAMPVAVVDRYNQAYRAAVSGQAARDRFEQLAFEAVPTTPREMAAIHRTEYDLFRKAVHEDGIKLE